MADTYISACFAFPCQLEEWEHLREGFLLAMDLSAGLEPDPPSAEFTALFPPDGDDKWSGFLDLFDDPDFTDFGADLAGGPDRDGCVALISAERDFQPDPVARLIQRCCQSTLAAAPVGFEWSVTCSRQRVGEFGGGWCVVFPDRIEFERTGEGIRKALQARHPSIDRLVTLHGPWGEYPAYPLDDWKQEIMNGDTRLGYWAWVDGKVQHNDGSSSP